MGRSSNRSQTSPSFTSSTPSTRSSIRASFTEEEDSTTASSSAQLVHTHRGLLLLARNPSATTLRSSSRAFYYAAPAAAVPFEWEAQPGKPKDAGDGSGWPAPPDLDDDLPSPPLLPALSPPPALESRLLASSAQASPCADRRRAASSVQWFRKVVGRGPGDHYPRGTLQGMTTPVGAKDRTMPATSSAAPSPDHHHGFYWFREEEIKGNLVPAQHLVVTGGRRRRHWSLSRALGSFLRGAGYSKS